MYILTGVNALYTEYVNHTNCISVTSFLKLSKEYKNLLRKDLVIPLGLDDYDWKRIHKNDADFSIAWHPAFCKYNSNATSSPDVGITHPEDVVTSGNSTFEEDCIVWNGKSLKYELKEKGTKNGKYGVGGFQYFPCNFIRTLNFVRNPSHSSATFWWQDKGPLIGSDIKPTVKGNLKTRHDGWSYHKSTIYGIGGNLSDKLNKVKDVITQNKGIQCGSFNFLVNTDKKDVRYVGTTALRFVSSSAASWITNPELAIQGYLQKGYKASHFANMDLMMRDMSAFCAAAGVEFMPVDTSVPTPGTPAPPTVSFEEDLASHSDYDWSTPDFEP